MKKFIVLFSAFFLVAAQGLAGTGKHLVYNVSSTIYEDIIHADHADIEESELEEEVDSFANSVTIRGGTFNNDVIVGESEYGDAYQNELHVHGGTYGNLSDLKAGYSRSGNAAENIVRVNGVTLRGELVAGDGAVDATDNVLSIASSNVNYNASSPNKIIAGKGYSGNVSYNRLNLTDGTVVDAVTAAGYSDGEAEVSYNTVTVDGNSLLNNTSSSNGVYGGYAAKGHSVHNQISLRQAGNVAADLYGGYSNGGAAEYNLVQVEQAGNISGAVYGGYTSGADQAYYNEVRIQGGTLSSEAAGGWAAAEGNALNNRVTVESNAVLADSALVYGGYAAQGEASRNTVSLASASVGKAAYGGYAAAGAANGNSLTVFGATRGGNTLAGGYSAASTADNNALSLQGVVLSSADGWAGGYAAAGASGNTLTAVQSALTGNVYGGRTAAGHASGNRVSVTGETVSGNIYGGYTQDGEASGNTVELDGVTVDGDVYAGYSSSGNATVNNTLILSGNTKINGDFYGGNGTESSGNSLLLRNYTGSVNAVDSFERVTIYGLGSDVTFNEDVAGGIDVQLYGKPSEMSQVLAHTQSGTELTLNRGVLGAYAYSLTGTPNGSLTDWSVKGQYQNDLAKPYAQAQLAGLALATIGDDMLEDAFNEAVALNTPNDSFGGVQYYDNSYETGSGFDLQSFVVQGGHWYKPGDYVWGWFVRYGHGQYDTDPQSADGGIDDFGLGGFVLLPYSDEGRIEAVLRAGYQTGDFSSDELSSSLDLKGFYGVLSAGLVQNVSALQLYGKINWLYLTGDDGYDNLGQNVDFDAVQSLSGKIGAKLNLGTLANKYKPYVGVAGIYEIDGESSVSVDGHNVSDVEMDGLTGQAELGISYENVDAMLPMKSSVSVFGLAGQAEGWGANVRLAFSF